MAGITATMADGIPAIMAIAGIVASITAEVLSVASVMDIERLTEPSQNPKKIMDAIRRIRAIRRADTTQVPPILQMEAIRCRRIQWDQHILMGIIGDKDIKFDKKVACKAAARALKTYECFLFLGSRILTSILQNKMPIAEDGQNFSTWLTPVVEI